MDTKWLRPTTLDAKIARRVAAMHAALAATSTHVTTDKRWRRTGMILTFIVVASLVTYFDGKFISLLWEKTSLLDFPYPVAMIIAFFAQLIGFAITCASFTAENIARNWHLDNESAAGRLQRRLQSFRWYAITVWLIADVVMTIIARHI